MERYDVVVIGAGISGLSLAHYCAQAGLRTAVLEKSHRIGGALHSQRFDDGFWLEMGAHTCYNSYGHLLGILEACGALEHLRPRRKASWMLWQRGRLHSIVSRLHVVELLFSLPRLLTARRRGSTVEGYYARVLGRRNFREVVGPMLNAVASQEAGGIPAELLFKKRPRRREIARSFTVEGGLQSIPEAIAAQGGFTLVTECPVASIAAQDGGYAVACEDGRQYTADALALATPADAAAALLAGTHPELAAVLGQVRVQAFESLGVTVRGERVSLPLLAGIVGIDERFFSVVSRDPVAHPELRGFAFHFRPGVDESARREHAAALLGLAEPDWQGIAGTTNVLPCPAAGHEQVVAGIDRLLQGRRLMVTGNYFGGLAIEDCVTRSAREVERLQTLL